MSVSSVPGAEIYPSSPCCSYTEHGEAGGEDERGERGGRGGDEGGHLAGESVCISKLICNPNVMSLRTGTQRGYNMTTR